jgi:hypothetical protein
MTRSKKKAGPSTRKQPVQRRTRNRTVRRSTAASTSLRKSTGRSIPPPVQNRASDELPTLPRGVPLAALEQQSSDEVATLPRGLPGAALPDTGHRPLLTERPVARSLSSDTEVEVDVEPDSEAGSLAPPTVAREPGSSPPWLLALAAIVLGGVIWVAFANSGSKSSNLDASAGKPDTQLPELPVADAPPVAEPTPPAEEPAQVVIDLDEPAPSKPTTRRVLSAKPAPKAEVVQRRSQAAVAAFDPSAADAALDTAAQQASSCRQAGDPTGVAKVVVTFAPSGRVTSAMISGPPFAGTQTGSCIAKTMRGMSLPAFEGEHMTISKTVVIM